MSSPTPPPRIAAIIPVGTLEGAKTRLGGTIDAEERHDLVEGMVTRTVEAALAVMTAGRLADVVVVSPDREVLTLASGLGARTLRQRSRGLNNGLREARDDVAAGGADAVLVLPIDLALINAEAIEPLVDAIETAPRGVVLVTDRHETGTNALGLRPPDVIGFCFGPGSRAKHRSAAAAADVPYTELDGPLALDLDTPDDLVLIESIAPERLGVG